MSVRTNVIAIAIATMAIPAAFAQSSSVFVGGEQGWVDRPVQSSTTRQQVTNEYLQFNKNPVLADGTRYVGGEEGYVLSTNIPQNPPAATPTAFEMRVFKQQNPA